MGQASRLSMTGKLAPDPDPGMPVPPAISSSTRWRLLRCARNDISRAQTASRPRPGHGEAYRALAPDLYNELLSEVCYSGAHPELRQTPRR